jgi:hypothetical protein
MNTGEAGLAGGVEWHIAWSSLVLERGVTAGMNPA